MYPFYQRCLLKLSLLFPGNTLETPLASPLSIQPPIAEQNFPAAFSVRFYEF